ncbi:MAG: PH domain-containing protein [Ruminococcus sp.]|nr:PH domain-containing protein [Ruminococcus sp.]MDE6670710.1 PH domain-containing protein [Ruminococcus sp.]
MKKSDIPYVWTDKKRTFLGLPWSFTRYFLTETKIITRKGFFNIEEDELEIYKIDDKKLSFPFGQRLCGCGTVIIQSRDCDTPVKEIKCVKNARKVSDMIDQYLNIQRDKYNIRGRDLISNCNHEPDNNNINS